MDTPIDQARLLAEVKFNQDGLVPVVVQEYTDNMVLMHAWMNIEALKQTLATGDVTYFSRSRQKLWRKGETSGHTQKLREIAIDCDGDTLLIKVEQTGAACHTGQKTCFYRVQDTKGNEQGW